MKTLIILLTIGAILYFGLPAIINYFEQKNSNNKLLSNIQNLDEKWNSGVVRLKNGRFMKKDDNN
tara:strand:+ start:21035 stop:21229 length:195 start_codon:yes stop_codon:yes gene_type:complete